MYEKTDNPYKIRIKVFVRNTWDYVTVDVRKSDIDYIDKHCKTRKELVPTLRRRGKNWYLDFAFEENVQLNKIDIHSQRIVAVDLGINNACVCSVMKSDGTVLGRRFLSLPNEKDQLNHAMNRVKKTQQQGLRRMPRLWAKVKGLTKDIAVKTAQFIMAIAKEYNTHTIVFEHLDLQSKKKGNKGKKYKLHLWKAKAVQSMVGFKVHRLGMRIATANAYNTSALAFDGSGYVKRHSNNFSICTFANGKIYNCDLSASYNIGARYFIKQILNTLPSKVRLRIETKDSQYSKRSTCTLATLISLNADLVA